MEFNISLVLLDLEKSIKENLKEVLLNLKNNRIKLYSIFLKYANS